MLCGAVVQLVRIPACHAGGRGFEPRPLRQSFLKFIVPAEVADRIRPGDSGTAMIRRNADLQIPER